MDINKRSYEERGKCWKSDFSVEFPISYVDISNSDGQTRVIVGPPHSDYKIITRFKNQRMDGESTLLSDKNVLIATLKFVEGVANGPCTIYDEWGTLFFEGSFVNGYRQGKGKEYDEKGKLINEGLYEKGRKLVKMTEMEGYWKDYDNSMNLLSICKKDNEGRNIGICYYYENGKICRMSEWQEGKEYPFIGYFKLFDEPHSKWIDGFYKEGRILHFSPMAEMIGYWKEYDNNGNLIHICEIDNKGNYNGICYNFENGILQGICRWEEGRRKFSYNGYYKVYNVVQTQWMEGYYENGKLLNMTRLYEMSGYWKEYDNNGHLKSICKKDIYGRYEGICYFYENGTMTRVSEWQEGKEYPFIGYFKLFDEPHSKWIDGFYKEGRILHFSPMAEMIGYWKEYDNNGNLIHICEIDNKGNYNGICYNFENGILQGICRWEEGRRKFSYNGYYKVYNVVQTQWMEGYYENGKLLNMTRLYEMSGYWKEYDNNGHLKSICKKDIYGRYEGICYFYENGTMTRVSEWHDGIEISLSGRCKFYDEPNKVWYEGGYKDGLREGKSVEYDTSGKKMYQGFYKKGNKLTPMKNKKHFWEERDNQNIIVRICQIDANGRYHGLSYQFREDQIIRVSRWREDREIELLKLFSDGMMTEYKDGKKIYVGGYINLLQSNYKRQGEGEEYDIDGETLLYKGSFMNGKREGHGRLYGGGKAIFDGAWKKGIKLLHYILYMVLILAIMLLSSAACFIFFNAYVGAIISGIYFTAICFYIHKYAGLTASGLFIVMCCFFIHLYAGLIASVIFVIILAFCFNVLAGFVPTGLVIIVTCLYYNTNAGIFAIGLFLIYIIFLLVHCCGLKKSIIYSSIVYILSLCTIISLVLIFKKVALMKYVIVFATGILLILILSLIAGCNKDKVIPLILSAMIIIVSCITISLLLHPVQHSYFKYVIISLVGLLLIFVVNLIVIECDGSTTIVLKCGVVIVVSCIIINTAIGSFSLPALKYVSVFTSGLLLIIIVSFITGCNEENMHKLLSSSGLIFFCCVLVSFLISSLTISNTKYYLVFLIGMILFFFTYLILSTTVEEVDIVPALFSLILVICAVTDLIMAAFEIYYMRFVSVIAIGFIIIIFLFIFTECGLNNPCALFSGIGTVIFSCYLLCWLLGGNRSFFSKYLIVFAVSSFIVFITNFFMSLCEADVSNGALCAGIVYMLCIVVELIMGSIENEIIRFISIFLFGVVLIIFVIICSDCLSDNTMLSMLCINFILCACSGACLLLGGKKYFILLVIFYSLLYSLALLIVICCCGCCCCGCGCCDDD